MADTIAALIVKLLTDQAELVTGMQQANKSIDAIGTHVAQANDRLDLLGTVGRRIGGVLAGAFTVAAVVDFTRDVVAAGDRLDDLSQRTGIGVRALQAFETMAKRSGTSLEAVTAASEQLGKRLFDGDKGAVKAVESLGLNVQALLAMRPEDRLTVFAEAVGGLNDPAQRASVSMAALGRSGLEIGGMMQRGLGEARRAIEESSSVITDEQAKTLSMLSDMWDDFANRSKTWGAKLIAGFAAPGGWFQRAIGMDEVEATMDRLEGHIAEIGRINSEIAAAVRPPQDGSAAWRALAAEVSEAQRVFRQLDEGTKNRMRDMLEWGLSVKQVATEFETSERVVQRLIDVDKLKEEQDKKNTEATKKREEAERRLTEAHREQVQAIRDQLFGDDVIKRAQLYAEAVGSVENVTRLSADAQRELSDVMTEAIDALVLSNRASDDLTNTFEVLRLQAQKTGRDAAAAFQKMQAEAALAAEMARQAALLPGLSIFGQRPASPVASGLGGVTIFNETTAPGSLGIALPRAAGGPVVAGHPYIVGERRPELFVPNVSGTILPSLGGDMTVNISGLTFLRDRAAMAEFMAMLKQELMTDIGRQRKLQGA